MGNRFRQLSMTVVQKPNAMHLHGVWQLSFNSPVCKLFQICFVVELRQQRFLHRACQRQGILRFYFCMGCKGSSNGHLGRPSTSDFELYLQRSGISISRIFTDTTLLQKARHSTCKKLKYCFFK